MNIKLFFTTVFATFAMQASADNYLDTEVLTVEVPEMKAELVDVSTLPANSMSLDLATTSMNTVSTTGSWKPDFDFFKSKTNPGVKPYKFMDDMTFAGIPLFVAGLAVKGDKAMFRVNNDKGKKNTQLLTNFKTGIDDYSQFFGPAMVVGLKLGGYEGRSDWPRLLASAGMSYGIMALLVNGIKYTAKEMRPDGSSANSWPSGHTATAFVGATLLHKEYGLTRSPWFSVAGYGVAAATGVMRVLNNRHWVSDVMSGAGIGIMSAELGYALCDLLFKGKGLLRNDLKIDSENPSFFSISMGVGVGAKDVSFGVDDMIDIDRFSPADIAAARAAESEEGKEIIEFRHATVVDGEGAYFFNKYIGVGGRLRVRAMSAKSFDRYADLETMAGNSWDAWDVFYKNNGKPQTAENYEKWDNAMWGEDLENGPIKDMNAIVESDHLTEFSASVGLYLNLPLSKHFSLGTKAEGAVAAFEPKVKAAQQALENGTCPGNDFLGWLHLPSSITPQFLDEIQAVANTLREKCEVVVVAGIGGSYLGARAVNSYLLAQNIEELSPYLTAEEYKRTKKMNYFTLGLSFMVNL